MRRCFHSLLLITALTLASAVDARAQIDLDNVPTDKVAQTGLKFLNFSVDPRAAGMANALTAQNDGSSVSMFYNPATMAHMTGNMDVFLANTSWIADITYNAASIAYSPANGRFGVFGLNVVSVDYGVFEGTIRTDDEQGFADTGNFSPSAIAIGLGYARALSDRFAVGAVVKWAQEDIGAVPMSAPGTISGGQVNIGDTSPRDFSQSVVAFDFGVVYRTGFRSLNVAMRARNMSRDLDYIRNPFELPLTFQIGTSMNVVDFTDYDANMHSFVMSVDAERHRDHAEQIRIGGEYLFMNTLALRAGYAYPTDIQGVNLGAGVNLDVANIRLGADYAYTHFDLFGGVNQIGIKLGF